ncbi:hypothetical protein LOD99_2319 [Oopsacas minuta]|uniref:Uncharacterized protein n=1 Tax=Oopsacas minuta TaxID=111878 RepID=A0AAV7K389_9METZ|nr:hypothetical protein LOD99_2319 [Oopsacas minuta]
MSSFGYHGNEGGFNGSSTTVGYNYVFIGSVDEQFKCLICKKVMRDAVQTQCGHHFCYSCIFNFVKNSPNCICPICHTQLDPRKILSPDEHIRERVRCMQIMCPHPNCQTIGTIDEIERSHMNYCDFRNFVRCDVCMTSMDKSQLPQHIQMCGIPIYKCEYCHSEIVYANKNHHELSCPNFKISCKYCGFEMYRIKYEEHCKNSCTAIRRDCPYEKCPFKGQLQQINDHLISSAFLHASFYQDQVNELEMKNREMGNQLRKLEKLHKGLAQSSYGSKQKTSSFFRRFMPPFNGEDWEDFQEFTTFPTNGKLIWKISNFKNTFLESGKYTKIYSQPFYTSPEGFKLSCYLYKQDNQVMMVCFQIMEGEFDEILDSLSSSATVLMLNKIRSNSISYDVKLYCDSDRTSKDIGCVELLAFQQILHFIGSSSLIMQIGVK